MRLGERTEEQRKVEVVPTGSIALDLALGVGRSAAGENN